MIDISTPCILSEIRQMFHLALFQNLKIRILILKFAENPQKTVLKWAKYAFSAKLSSRKRQCSESEDQHQNIGNVLKLNMTIL